MLLRKYLAGENNHPDRAIISGISESTHKLLHRVGSKRIPSLWPINSYLSYCFTNGLLVKNVGEVFAGVIGRDPPNDVVRGNVAVDAVEGVVAGTGSVAQGKLGGWSGRGNSEVVGYRGESSDGGLEVVVVVVVLCHCSPMACKVGYLVL